MDNAVALILAAGKGTRMKSSLPKVIHTISGVPMVTHVCRAVEKTGIHRMIMVVGFESEKVIEAVGQNCEFVKQEKQLGTGHAVLQAADAITEKDVLILYGDTPMLKSETIEILLQTHRNSMNDVTMLTARVPDPSGYGRILRNSHKSIVGIVEDKDASVDQKEINEINTGIYVFNARHLWNILGKVEPNNVQGEIYLTDVIGLFAEAGFKIGGIEAQDPTEIQGINTRLQLAQAEKHIQNHLRKHWMDEGVTMIDPDTVYIDLDVEIGPDTVLYPNTHLQGKTIIDKQARIGPNARINNSRIGAGTTIEQAVILDSKIANDCSVGPFAYIRPETVMENNSKVGTFVEVKKSHIRESSKVPHLSYIGDGMIGSNVNIGAGTIFVNYDGEKKHLTVVEDGAFVGCNANLVAPVTVRKNAYVAAGSTITKEVPEDSLGIARARQENLEGWVSRKRKKQ